MRCPFVSLFRYPRLLVLPRLFPFTLYYLTYARSILPSPTYYPSFSGLLVSSRHVVGLGVWSGRSSDLSDLFHHCNRDSRRINPYPVLHYSFFMIDILYHSLPSPSPPYTSRPPLSFFYYYTTLFGFFPHFTHPTSTSYSSQVPRLLLSVYKRAGRARGEGRAHCRHDRLDG